MNGTSWPRALRARWLVSLIVVCAVGALFLTGWNLWGRGPAAAPDAAATGQPTEPGPPADPDASGLLTLPRNTWSTAGLKLAAAEVSPLSQVTRVTGKVALNTDRVAHIYPLVEGRVEEVRVRFGDRVAAGQVLAIVQSKEVGQAKLELYQNRHLRDFAHIKLEWQQTISENTRELIAALEKETPIEEIEKRFQDQPMGDFRQQLLSSYANYLKAEADYERIRPLAERSLAPARQLTAARTTRDVDWTKLRAWMEQIRFDSHQQAVLAQQELRQAETRIAVNETTLQILGYGREELADIDPARQGAALAHYPIRAPFDGTIISKDVALLESVGPDRQILQIADLSTVWITADIYEQHLPLLAGLSGRDVRFRSTAYPDREFTAQVFYTGEIVDEKSRTVRLQALAENPDGVLKAGMFGEVELPEEQSGSALQVPASAVLEHEGEKFVFVHQAEDRFEKRRIEVGRQGDGSVEILSGLRAGESIAVSGGFALKSRMLADMLAEE